MCIDLSTSKFSRSKSYLGFRPLVLGIGNSLLSLMVIVKISPVLFNVFLRV